VLASAAGVLALTMLVHFKLGTWLLPDMDERAFVRNQPAPAIDCSRIRIHNRGGVGVRREIAPPWGR
jgi:hypothetical protein